VITVIGKVLVWFIAIVSLFGLGVAAWLPIADENLDNEIAALKKEADLRHSYALEEYNALERVLLELRGGSREMPWDVEAQLYGGKLKSVRETRNELEGLRKTNTELKVAQDKLEDQVQALIGKYTLTRKETNKLWDEQKELRLLINPEGGEAKPYRDRLDDLRAAKAAAEDREEKTRPDLNNELVRISIQLKRQEELRNRLKELEAAPGARAAAAPVTARR
jgi:chromosome segregation ATPase